MEKFIDIHEFLQRFPEDFDNKTINDPIRIVLLGAGFSMEFCPKLNFKNLTNLVCDSRSDLRKINIKYPKKNLDEIIDLLRKEYEKNKVMYKDNINIISHIAEQIHIVILNICKRENLKPLYTISHFLKRFDHVLTLNYDPIIYWGLMNRADEWTRVNNEFSDLFCYDVFHTSQPSFERWCIERSRTFVYYLHGSIFIVYDKIHNYTKKIKANQSKLEQSIISQIRDDTTKLNIVLEGNSDYKIGKINSNDYLKYVYNSIPKLNNLITKKAEVLIYGYSCSKYDEHITKQIMKINNARFTFTIYKNWWQPMFCIIHKYKSIIDQVKINNNEISFIHISNKRIREEIFHIIKNKKAYNEMRK